MIVTLAGHVDHGKTSLVQMMTGINTDRLTEERERGLTIDLGFAYMDGGKIGFVDVPGHHKFIHNMVAGVAGDQVALLVVAADDGPMPQSKEHLEILTLAGIERGVIALTKTDRVDAGRITECKNEINALVAQTFLQHAPVIETSINTPDTANEVLDAIRATAPPPPDQSEPFRYAIDRAFTLKGAGLVVTGTVHAGMVKEGDTLVHFPSQKDVRVRSIRAQDQVAHSGARGDRCAFNITGLELAEIKRGDWLTANAQTPAREITVELAVLSDFPRPIRHWLPVHIYHATSHSEGHIALHSNERPKPGANTLVDLVCDEGLAVQHGDRLIVRDHGLDTTLGGARVIFAAAIPTGRRRNPQRLALLKAYQAPSADACCQNLLEIGSFDTEAFASTWHLDTKQVNTLLEQHQALRVGKHAIARKRLAELAKAALDKITQHMQDQPSSPGLKENAFTALLGAFTKQVLGALVQTKRASLQGGFYALPSHQAQLPEELAQLWNKLEPQLDQLQPPSSGDLAKLWRTDHITLERNLKELTKRGRLVHIAEHRYYLPQQLEKAATAVKALAATKPFSVKEFRDHTQIGRNVAIDLLEYFDSKGFTKRRDNERVLLRPHL